MSSTRTSSGTELAEAVRAGTTKGAKKEEQSRTNVRAEYLSFSVNVHFMAGQRVAVHRRSGGDQRENQVGFMGGEICAGDIVGCVS